MTTEARGRLWFRAVLMLTVALTLSLAIAAFVAATSWGALAYSTQELRAQETATDRQVREIREQEINQLRIALGRRLAANRRADLYFRLAEIYVEAYRTDFILEGRVNDKRLEKGGKNEPIDRTQSRKNLQAAVNACREILTSGVEYPNMDRVLYFLGYSYGELEQRKEGAKYFDQLIRDYPKSELAAEAYREVGDDAFDDGNYQRALSLYQQALPRSSSEAKAKILHKMAWSYYRTRQPEKAVATMKQCIAEASKSGERFVSVREEALRDMAIFMTETGQVKEAITYFQQVSGDKDYYPKALERLGKQYERNVEPEKATQVYEVLMQTRPDSEEAFRVFVKLVDLDIRRKQYDQALNRIANAQIPKRGDDETMTALANLRAMVRRTATENHNLFRQKGEKRYLNIADAFYGVYLNRFLASDDPRNETPEIQMYLAEVKRDQGKSAEASMLYRGVLQAGDKRYSKEAGALWTASLSEAVRQQALQNPVVGPKPNAPTEIERDYVYASDQLAENLKGTPEAREASLKSAQVLAGYRDTQDDAAERSARIAKENPQSQQGLTAAKLLLQIRADSVAQKDGAKKLRDAIDEVKGNSTLMAYDKSNGKGELAASVADQERRIVVNIINTSEKTQDFVTAGRGYEKFAVEATSREVAEKAYVSAIASYLKSTEPESVERVGADWLKRYPGSPKASEQMRGAATQFLILGRFDLAGSLFERLGRGGDAASLDTAARLAEGLGDIKRAQALWTTYLAAFKNNSQRFAVALGLAKSYELNKQEVEAARQYPTCMGGTSAVEAECGSRWGDLYLRSGDIDSAKVIYRKVAALGGRKAGGVSPYVAYARYRLAEMMEREAKFDALALPEANLRKALDQRLGFLEPLSRAYNAAVDAGGPWGVAALNRLALWAYVFALEVERISPTAGSSLEAAARFRATLRTISDPLRKKAIETWSQGYSKAVAGEILSPALPEITDYLAGERAREPVLAQGFRGRFRLAGVPADGGGPGQAVTAMEATRGRLLKSEKNAQAWADYGNLLWGERKPLIAKLVYEYALTLNAKNPAALNNRAVLSLSGDGIDDWLRVGEATQLFEAALRQDGNFLSARVNRAILMNYYRLFPKARPLWDSIVKRAGPGSDLDDGFAVSLQGTGRLNEAVIVFNRATAGGMPPARFVNVFNEAARYSREKGDGPARCAERLDDLNEGSLAGFEKRAFDSLRRSCQQWKDLGQNQR